MPSRYKDYSVKSILLGMIWAFFKPIIFGWGTLFLLWLLLR